MADCETQALLEALEQATEGSRGLSDRIARAAGWQQIYHGDAARGYLVPRYMTWRTPGGGDLDAGRCPPDFSTSIDAALTLLPEGSEWTRHRGANGKMTMQVDGPNYFGVHGQGATPALALCIAALKARQQQEAGDE